MATIEVFSTSREKVSQVELDDSIFDAPVKDYLFYDVIRWQTAKRRQGSACTKNRSEVSGGGKKPWRQKGTGRARAGTSRSPIWKGGGTVFGPKPRDYGFKMPKRVKRAALCSALTLKRQNEKLTILDKFELAQVKTKAFVEVLSRFEADSVLIVDNENNRLALSARNVPGVKVLSPQGLNLFDLLKHENLFITQACLDDINRRFLS
ncbi:MAG: 50S ribosomal protein L4 [Deltaproteobacteria bacterium]|nr:50S ribosomal protein L4 [Deltaproteobacteria bacterium]